MKGDSVAIFLMLSLVGFLPAQCTEASDYVSVNRRILHQPLFPSTAGAPPPRQDQPFSDEQGQQSPPPVLAGSAQAATNPVSDETLSKGKKIAIAISSAVLTLAMLSALAFYLCKHCAGRPDESRKLVGGDSVSRDARMPPSNFLYIGTVEPSSRSFVEDFNGANCSPYRKLNSGRRSDRYRPSPDLQPLPPLPRPRPPPPMSSSDDDSHDTDFYTPQGSSISSESPSSRHGYLRHTVPVMIPSIKQSLPPPAPPPAYRERLRLINGDDQQNPKIPMPPPPPPPAAVLFSISRKIGGSETHNQPPISKSNSEFKKTNPINESNRSVTSSERCNDRDNKEGSKPKLKPLHWDKVRATSDRATVWDQLNSNSFQLNEEAMESLFGCDSANLVPKEASRKGQECRVLDPKKSQNIAILLRALNVTSEEVSKALLDGNPGGLGTELLETLVKMAPTKEEEIKLKQYRGDVSRLGSAEQFLKAILDIPFAFKRVEAMLYRANFNAEVAYLRKSFKTLEEASEELKNSRLFVKLLEAVLRTGNRMNDGTNRGDARAFKLDTLLKLADVKGTDGKTTLLHFVVQEIIRSEGADSHPTDEINQPQTEFKFKEDKFKKQGLQVVSGLSQELLNVKRAAGMDSDVLSSYVAKLETGLEKVRSVIQLEKQGKFFDSTKDFLNEAAEEIVRIKAEERKALSVVKEVTEYFHGDAAKEEAHPLRTFMIVRDFLAILDNVCRDVKRMQGRQATMGAGRSFRMATLPVLNR